MYNPGNNLSMIRYLIFLLAFMTISMNGISQEKSPVQIKPIYFFCPPCNLDCDTIHFQKPGICPNCGMTLFAAYEGYENKNGNHQDICNKKVAVLLFQGVEIIDFAGPWEVFGAAGMDVFSVANSDDIITTSMSLKLKPDYTFQNAPNPDIILVPGGNVDPSDIGTVNWITAMNTKTEHTMSVCTGAFYLAAGGLLDNLQATTNYPAVINLKKRAPKATVLDSVRYVDNGKIITAAGLSSGIDAAFHLVSLYIGKAQTKKLANSLEYRWDDTLYFVRSKLADKYVQDFLNLFNPYDYKMKKYAGDENKWTVELNIESNLNQNDLLNLIEYQLIHVSGWEKNMNDHSWSFKAHGKMWQADVTHAQTNTSSRNITLTVYKL